ncbi:MAG: (2Fe-2S)-binding protein [Acidobacteriota bacterium]|nr:MAG: (2Fe-2S)-binding protein [Acidobacteriota bacterium]
MTEFEASLSHHSENVWLTAVDELLPSIHEVDRNAVQVWFRFYPLGLQEFLAENGATEETLRRIAMQGEYSLATQIDTSHHFLYGHRYWKKVKCVIEKMADEMAEEPASLVDLIKSVSIEAAEKLGVERKLVNAIAAVGLMTLNQVGLDAFKAASGEVAEPKGLMAKSPDAIVAERAKDDSQGLLGFLRTVDKQFSVNHSALNYTGKFTIINDEEIVTASQKDHSQNWQASDARCWEGPVPIECTSASCGTCWVGVLAGEEKLTPPPARERRQMKVFGYNQPVGDHPFLRLACQARAEGNVHIVIPPWNAVFGKKVYGNVEEVELEPVTTSAKKLREVVKEATSGE